MRGELTPTTHRSRHRSPALGTVRHIPWARAALCAALRAVLASTRSKLGLITAWWIAFALLYLFSLLEVVPFEDIALRRAATSAAVGWLLSIPLALGVAHVTTRPRQVALWSGAVLLTALWAAVGWVLQEVADPFLTSYPTYLFLQPGQEARLDSPATYPVVMLGQLVGLLWLDQRRRLREQRVHLAEVERAEQRARLAALRYQLNPHFLFNALNSIGVLAAEDAERTQKVVAQLADFLRYSLVPTETAPDAEAGVTLEAELQAVQAYLAIEKVRFEEDLQLQLEIDPAANAKRVPPFLLLPLVDNAIKHGQRTSPIPLVVALSAQVNGDVLDIEVANTGSWLDSNASDGTSTGLANVRERLAVEYPERHSFESREDDGWVRIHISLTEGTE